MPRPVRTTGGDHHVRAERAEFLRELALDIEIEIEKRGNHRGAADQREKRDGQAAAAAAQQLQQQAPEHHSPRRIGAGSKCAARRSGIRLPTIATTAARPRTTGKQNQSRRSGRAEDACRPARAQAPAPKRSQRRRRPSRASIVPREKFRRPERWSRRCAFMMPISARRSSTVVAEVAATASAAAISAASVTIQSSVLTRDRMRPSVSATRRMARTSVPGKNLLNLKADRRNVRRAEPAVVFGGRERGGVALGERVGGLGERADEKLAELAGMAGKFLRDRERDEAWLLSSASPVERIPVTRSGTGLWLRCSTCQSGVRVT